MHEADRLMLANLGKLNHAMGLATRDFLHEMRPDGRLPADRLRELARICDDMARLLDNVVDEIDPPDDEPPLVIDASPDRPVGAIEPSPVAPDGSLAEVHQHIADLRDSARRSRSQGLYEAGDNFAMAADQKVAECGCGHCEPPAGA